MTSRLAGHGRHDEDGDDASPDGSDGGWMHAQRADAIISPMARLRQAQHRCRATHSVRIVSHHVASEELVLVQCNLHEHELMRQASQQHTARFHDGPGPEL